MIPLQTLGRVKTPDGVELALYHRDGVYQIRIDGLELMTSRAHGSEEALAHLACAALEGRKSPRLLVGGLGMGYTLRAALDALPASAEVVVAEYFPAVVAWNRGPLAALARRPLDDPRVEVIEGDVGRLLASSFHAFDAIVLDVDNGPVALTLNANQWIYGAEGLAAIRRALLPGGLVAVWSSAPEPAFARRLGSAGFVVQRETVRARGRAGGPRHTIYLGRRK